MSMHQHPFSSDFKTMFSDRHYGIFGVGEAVLLSVKGIFSQLVGGQQQRSCDLGTHDRLHGVPSFAPLWPL